MRRGGRALPPRTPRRCPPPPLDVGARAAVTPECDAAHVVAVSGLVEEPVVGVHEQPASEHRVLRMRLCRADERLEPGRLGERVGVEQRDVVAVGAVRDSEVVRRRKAEVLVRRDQLDGRVQLRSRRVGARVVDDDDAVRRRRLCEQAFNGEREKLAGVVVDDDDADARRLHAGHTRRGELYPVAGHERIEHLHEGRHPEHARIDDCGQELDEVAVAHEAAPLGLAAKPEQPAPVPHEPDPAGELVAEPALLEREHEHRKLRRDEQRRQQDERPGGRSTCRGTRSCSAP